MNMLKLLKKIGDADIEYQDLAKSMLGGSASQGKETDEIRVAIPKGRMNDQFRKVNGLPSKYEAFIVWLPTESVKAVMKNEPKKKLGKSSTK